MDKLRLLPLGDINIDDAFWNRYTKLIPEVVLPYQWEVLNDRVPNVPASYCLQNFRIAAGQAQGQRLGTVFQDTDAYKWLEAVAYSLAARPDEALSRHADEVIALICAAQQPDGYLDTYYTLLDPAGRWQNLTEGHELYCAGHLFEAAAAYYEATQKRALLDAACRFANLIDTVFGPSEHQMHGYPGHPEVELGLVRLYEVTGEEKYLSLCQYFVDVRGGTPNYFLEEIKKPGYHSIYKGLVSNYDPAYAQSHRPVRLQKTAEGHAVRATYLYCAMADIALHRNDAEMLQCCQALWDNIVQKRMFITGGIGSSGVGERFTADFDLPNDSNYAETCASVGLARFALRMARLTRNAAYIDVAEQALYNTVRAGIALEGERYFYVNPLEVWPDICMPHTSRAHVKPVRQKWFDCACCPTNIARTIAGLGQYLYAAAENALFVNLFAQSSLALTLGGKPVQVRLATDYPKTGNIRLSISAQNAAFTLHVRVPGFAQSPALKINGQPVDIAMKNGYLYIERTWGDDTVELSFEVRPRLCYANPLVRAGAGKAAIVRGPEVYCLEEADNGTNLAAVSIAPNAVIREEWDEMLLGGTMVLHLEGEKWLPGADAGASYAAVPNQSRAVRLTAVPYGSWNNRAPGEMIVWMHLQR